MVAIDECHLTSQWASFQENYKSSIMEQMRVILRPDIVWFGCTVDAHKWSTPKQRRESISQALQALQALSLLGLCPDTSVRALLWILLSLRHYEQLRILGSSITKRTISSIAFLPMSRTIEETAPLYH